MTREFNEPKTNTRTVNLCPRCSSDHILVEKYHMVAERVLDKHTCYKCDFVWYEDVVPVAHGIPTTYEHPDITRLKKEVNTHTATIAALQSIIESQGKVIDDLHDLLGEK